MSIPGSPDIEGHYLSLESPNVMTSSPTRCEENDDSDDYCDDRNINWYETRFRNIFESLEDMKTRSTSTGHQKESSCISEIDGDLELQKFTSFAHSIFSDLEQLDLYELLQNLGVHISKDLCRFEKGSDMPVKDFIEDLQTNINNTVCTAIVKIAEERKVDEMTLKIVRLVVGGEGDFMAKMRSVNNFTKNNQFLEKDANALEDFLTKFKQDNPHVYSTYEFERSLTTFKNRLILEGLGLGVNGMVKNFQDGCGSLKQKGKRKCEDGGPSKEFSEFPGRTSKRCRRQPDWYTGPEMYVTGRKSQIMEDGEQSNPFDVVSLLNSHDWASHEDDSDWFDCLHSEDEEEEEEEYEEEYEEEELPREYQSKKVDGGCSSKGCAAERFETTDAEDDVDVSTFENLVRDFKRNDRGGRWAKLANERWSPDLISELERIVHSSMIIATTADTITAEQWSGLDMCAGDLFASSEVVEKRRWGMENRLQGGISGMLESNKIVVDFQYDPLEGGVPFPCFKFDTSLKCNQIKAVQFFLRALSKSSHYKFIKLNQLQPRDPDFTVEKHSSPLLGLNSFSLGVEMLPFVWHMLNTTVQDSSAFEENRKKAIIKVKTLRYRRMQSRTLNANFLSKGGIIVACRRGVREILKTKCFMGHDGQHDSSSTKDGLEVARVAYMHGDTKETKKIMRMYPNGKCAITKNLKDYLHMTCRFEEKDVQKISQQPATPMASLDINIP